MDALSLDQIRVFLSVVEEGSFSAAARKLGRAPSAVTYAVQNMENQLGTSLFDRSQYRPLLTNAGSVLLPHAQRVAEEVNELRVVARGIAGGLEAEVAIAIDSMFPMQRIFEPLKEFQHRFPSVRTRIYVESFGSAVKLLAEQTCNLGLVSRFAVEDLPLEFRGLINVELIVVAAFSHPLARVRGSIQEETLRDHIQLVLTDNSGLTGSKDYGVHSRNTWRLGDLGAKHAMLRAGLGYGSLPRHMVDDDITAGRLVAINVVDRRDSKSQPSMAMVLAWHAERPAGQATQWLRESLSMIQ